MRSSRFVFGLALMFSASVASAGGVKWINSMDEALKQSKKTGKPILIDFYADWCGWCKVLDKRTYPDPKVVKLMQKFVAVKLNVETQSGHSWAQYLKVSPLPTVLVIDANYKELARMEGFRPPEPFVKWLSGTLVSR